MLERGWIMLCLVAITGLSGGGCMQSNVLPPPAAVHAPRPLPPTTDALPLLRQPAHPWKPGAPARDWKYIVIHHTATNRGSVESIHEAHLRRKDGNGNPWLGIGYHFVIGNGDGMSDGAIEATFRWRQQMHGAHAGAGEYNERGIGIVLVGNFEEHSPTPAQLAAVKRLVGALKADYRIPAGNIVGHSDVRATACPGRYFPMAEVSRSQPDGWLVEHNPERAPVRTVSFEGNLGQ